MLIIKRHLRLDQMLKQRCFFLIPALLALLVVMPYLVETVHVRVIIGLLNIVILVTAVGAVETLLSHCDSSRFTDTLLSDPGAAVWLARTFRFVLRFRRGQVVCAVAAYVMIAILWAYLYGVLQYFSPGAYAYQGMPKTHDLADLIFYSFTVLTTAGFGGLTALLIQGRFATLLEAVTGVMYVAILIARLTGVYPVVGTKN